MTVSSMVGPIEFHLPSVSSTNDYARELLGSYPFVYVSAQHQTAGRGRNGRTWHGDFGTNVYCSFGIRHADSPSTEDAASYMARGALAALDVLRTLAPGTVFRLKYPNDIQVRTEQGWAKIAGVLVEHEYHGTRCVTTTVGIGVNVGQRTFPDTIGQPCSSLVLLGVSVDLPVFLSDLRDRFTQARSRPWFEIHEIWVRELDVLGKPARIAGMHESWTMHRVLQDGRLIVRQDVTQQERTVTDGDTIRYDD